MGINFLVCGLRGHKSSIKAAKIVDDGLGGLIVKDNRDDTVVMAFEIDWENREIIPAFATDWADMNVEYGDIVNVKSSRIAGGKDE